MTIRDIHDEVSAPKEETTVDVMSLHEGGQCEGVALQEGGKSTLIESAYCEFPDLQVFEKESTLAATSSSSSSSSSSSQQTAAFENEPKNTHHMDTTKNAKPAPCFSHQVSPLPSETIHAAANAAPTEHIETIAPAASAITPRECRMVEKWMSRTSVGDMHDKVEGFGGVWEGDDGDVDVDADADADTNAKDDEENVETTAWGFKAQSARSEIASVSVDTEFQNTLRAYMGKDGSREKGLFDGERGVGVGVSERGEQDVCVWEGWGEEESAQCLVSAFGW